VIENYLANRDGMAEQGFNAFMCWVVIGQFRRFDDWGSMIDVMIDALGWIYYDGKVFIDIIYSINVFIGRYSYTRNNYLS